MIENKFNVTEEGLLETSSAILWLMPKIRKLAIGMTVAVIALIALVMAFSPESPLPLMVILGGIMLWYCLSAIRKLPARMAKQLYADLKREAMDKANPKPERDEEDEYEDEEAEEERPLVEAEPHSHICVNDGGVLIVGLDDEGDLIFPYSRLVRTVGTKNYIIVLNDQIRAITFHRDGFLQGSAEELIATLREHCPKMKFGKGL